MPDFESHDELNNPWQLGHDLQAGTDEIMRFASHRDPESPATVSKIMERLVVWTEQYRGSRAFADAAVQLIPTPEGSAVGAGQTGGDIIGFTWSKYPQVDLTTLTVQPEDDLGVIMYLRVDGMQHAEDPKAAESWRLNVLPEEAKIGLDIQGFVIGVPIIPENHFAALAPTEKTPETVTELLARSTEAPDSQDYMAVVRRIDALTGRRATIHGIADQAIIRTVSHEIQELNYTSRLIGQFVVAESDHLRMPHPLKADAFLIIKGEHRGIMRKFVLAPYVGTVDKGELRAGVQAVVWDPEAFKLFQQGKLPANLIDSSPLAVFVPLSLPHSLRPDS